LEHHSPSDGVFQIPLLLALLIPAIIFLISEQTTLSLVQRQNRAMLPGLVWLQLIPLFGQVWQFVIVVKISDSIRKQFAALQDDSILGISSVIGVEEFGKRPGFAIGITYCVLFTAGVCINVFAPPTSRYLIVGPLLSLSGMTCWIIYWVQLAGYKRKLKTLPR
jgi:hypothetical protein